MRNPKSSYLRGESLFLHRDEGCCIYSVFLQQIPEDETILCMKTSISNVLLHFFFCFQSSENRRVCYLHMYIEINIFFSPRSLFLLLSPGTNCHRQLSHLEIKVSIFNLVISAPDIGLASCICIEIFEYTLWPKHFIGSFSLNLLGENFAHTTDSSEPEQREMQYIVLKFW